jgi:hypothetical protein
MGLCKTGCSLCFSITPSGRMQSPPVFRTASLKSGAVRFSHCIWFLLLWMFCYYGINLNRVIVHTQPDGFAYKRLDDATGSVYYSIDVNNIEDNLTRGGCMKKTIT